MRNLNNQDITFSINKNTYHSLIDGQINLSLLQLLKTLDTKIEMKLNTLNEFKTHFIEYFKVLEMYIHEGKKQLEIFINAKFTNDFNDIFDKDSLLIYGNKIYFT